MPNTIHQEPEAAVVLLRALRNTAVSVFYQDQQLRVLWARNVPDSWTQADFVGATDRDLLPPAIADRVIDAKRSVITTLVPDRFDFSIPGTDGARWFDIWIDADLDADGNLRGIITTAVETTEHKRREQTLRTLLREVSHRSRNLLAIIQSIATQTGRFSSTIDQFLARFRGRLQSLAASQDLVTSSDWRGANLGELVREQAARYSLTPRSAIRFSGASPWLNPNAALHIGLALHELAVNSVSYGALSTPNGVVTVAASLLEGGAGNPSLSLEWREPISAPQGISPNGPHRERRFGSIALEQVVPASLNGKAKLDITEGSLTYSLIIPSGNFEVE